MRSGTRPVPVRRIIGPSSSLPEDSCKHDHDQLEHACGRAPGAIASAWIGPPDTNFAGGNASAKGQATDPVTGDPVDLRWVKGLAGTWAL